MAEQFKIGDTVCKINQKCNSARFGDIYTAVRDVWSNNANGELGIGDDLHNLCHCPNEWELVTNKKIMGNLTEKFVLAFTSEPKKSFRKAGITNGDDVLTDEGARVFLTWLLHNKHAEEFKKDIVDGILEDKDAK